MNKKILSGNLDNWNSLLKAIGDERMLKLTETIDEHPENYNGPCHCRLCLSYGD